MPKRSKYEWIFFGKKETAEYSLNVFSFELIVEYEYA